MHNWHVCAKEPLIYTSGSTHSIRIDVGSSNVNVQKSEKRKKCSRTRGVGHRKKDMLDGSLLHFLPPESEIIFLNGNKEFARGSYDIFYKCHIVGVDFIPRHEEYACKAFITSVERNAITTMNMEAMSCPLIHPLFIKLFAIHPTKVHGYMRWWNAGTVW